MLFARLNSDRVRKAVSVIGVQIVSETCGRIGNAITVSVTFLTHRRCSSDSSKRIEGYLGSISIRIGYLPRLKNVIVELCFNNTFNRVDGLPNKQAVVVILDFRDVIEGVMKLFREIKILVIKHDPTGRNPPRIIQLNVGAFL